MSLKVDMRGFESREHRDALRSCTVVRESLRCPLVSVLQITVHLCI